MEPDRIETLNLFPELNARLLELVSGMSAADLEAKTLFPSWRVKDILAHLLGMTCVMIS
jgi:hypothetical protein